MASQLGDGKEHYIDMFSSAVRQDGNDFSRTAEE